MGDHAGILGAVVFCSLFLCSLSLCSLSSALYLSYFPPRKLASFYVRGRVFTSAPSACLLQHQPPARRYDPTSHLHSIALNLSSLRGCDFAALRYTRKDGRPFHFSWPLCPTGFSADPRDRHGPLMMVFLGGENTRSSHMESAHRR